MLLYKYMQKNLFALVKATVLIIFLCYPGLLLAQAYKFSKIVIVGNSNIETQTVESFLGLDLSKPIEAASLNGAYQRVLESGLFKSVEIIPLNNTLKVVVEEFPIIKSVTFEGNKRLTQEVLMELIISRPRFSLSPSRAERDADTIVAAYRTRGLISSSVTPKIINRPNNLVDLVFEVVEGAVTEVERVSFVGNVAYSDRRLRRILISKQAGLLRKLFRSDTFVADRVRFDKKILRDFYLDRGYVDFEVISTAAELSRDRGSYFMTFNIQEGEQYKFGTVSFSSNVTDLNPKPFNTLIKMKPGNIYSPRIVDNEIKKIENKIQELNLDFILVVPKLIRNEENKTLNINFALEKSSPNYVDRINIAGNRVTREYVIRRQFKSVEGDPFNPSEIRNSAARIRALGIFKDVNISTRASNKVSSVVVDVELEEQPTGSFGIGFSYSNDEGAGGNLKLKEQNFLGRGQFLSFSYSSLSDSNQMHIDFSEPQFLNRDLALGLKLGNKTTSQQFSAYDSAVTEFEPSFSFPLSLRSRLKVKYRYSDETLTSKATTLSSAISSQMGTKKLNTLGYAYDLDSKVDTIDPNDNVQIRFSQDYSIEDDNFSYIKTKAFFRRHKMVFREEVGLAANFEFGHLQQVEGKSRVVDRFKTFTRQMRGFKGAGIGPRDRHSTNKDPLGGQYFAVARLESDFPLMIPDEYKIRASIFLDAGSVWGLDDRGGTSGANQPGGIVDDKFHLRSTVGAGILWGTPIGPLRFDFTKSIKKLSYDKPESFNFSISTKF